MADAYWKCSDGLIQPVSPPRLAGKRPRNAPSGPEMPGYYIRSDEQVNHVIRDADPIEAHYEQYLQNGQISSYSGGESSRSMTNGVITQPIHGSHVMGIVGSEAGAAKSRSIGVGGGRTELFPLPPDASSTLFVEGLPPNCTRREVSHVFRPFLGYKEVRLVTKESRHPGGNPFVLCFVDFVSPAHAATSMDTLQGYKFDEHDPDSVNLRLQFARRPGSRLVGGYHGTH